MQFILDTGAKTCVLTEPLLTEFMNIDSMRSIQINGLGENQSITAHVADQVSLQVGDDISGTHVSLLVLPQGLLSFNELFGKPVYGIIGYEVFKQFVVEIDYENELLTLYDPKHFKKPKRYTKQPIKIERSMPFIEADVTHLSGKQERLKLLLDTGASKAASFLYENAPLPDQTIDAFLGKGIGGDIFGKLGRINSLHWGNFKFDDMVVGYPDQSDIGLNLKDGDWHGNIGGEVFKRFTVIFDYSNKNVYLRKNSNYKKVFKYNITGIELAVQNTNEGSLLTINHIRERSAAQTADLRVGDQLIFIDSHDLRDAGIGEAYYHLNKKAPSNIRIKVIREGEVLNKKIKLFPEL